MHWLRAWFWLTWLPLGDNLGIGSAHESFHPFPLVYFPHFCSFNVSLHPGCCRPPLIKVAGPLLSRVFQFSKRHALEECRQQVALSQGIRARLEVQRVLLKEKLDQLGPGDPPSALNQDQDAASLLLAAGSVGVGGGGVFLGSCNSPLEQW